MAHFHIHTLPDGTETSAPVIDPENDELHWHLVGVEKTSSNGPLAGEHTHTINGETTSPPIDRDTNDNDDNDDNKGNGMSIEVKEFGGQVVETKETERNGVKVGLISGYIATWDIDRGSWGMKDRFIRGAFAESILEHQTKNRQARFKDHHGRTVGGFPPSTLKEDERGLFGIAEVNLEVQQGFEAFSLAKQGVLTDFSVGFSSLEDTESNIDGDRVRSISKAILWEGSIIDEPMNPKANITEVKKFVVDDVKDWTERDLEKFLKETGKMSKSAAKTLATRLDKSQKQVETVNNKDLIELMNELKSFNQSIKGK